LAKNIESKGSNSVSIEYFTKVIISGFSFIKLGILSKYNASGHFQNRGQPTHRGQTSNGYKRSCAGYKRDLALDTKVPYGILL
jgi:hypothetical protein